MEKPEPEPEKQQPDTEQLGWLQTKRKQVRCSSSHFCSAILDEEQLQQ